MRIGMIMTTRFPPDIRVEKEIGTLAGRHAVFLLCPKRGSQAANEHVLGINVCRVFGPVTRWWSQWRLMSSCHSRAWQVAIERFLVENRIQVLHVHDLPLLGAAIATARRHGIPVIADLHENYPAMLEQGRTLPIRKIRSLGGLIVRLAVSVDRWKIYEREVVARADQVIVVIEEAKARLAALGVPSDRIHVVANYAARSEISLPGATQRDPSHAQATFRVVYAGGFDETRDLGTVVSAVRQLPRPKYRQLEVILVGGIGRSMQDLRDLARQRGVDDRVSVLPWATVDEVDRLMARASVGLVPHVKSPHTDATIPHKLFQYMWQRLPVIVSNCNPLERIVKSTSCGLVYESGNSESLASCLAELYEDDQRRAVLGNAGHEAVEREFNWTRSGEALLKVYEACAE